MSTLCNHDRFYSFLEKTTGIPVERVEDVILDDWLFDMKYMYFGVKSATDLAEVIYESFEQLVQRRWEIFEGTFSQEDALLIFEKVFPLAKQIELYKAHGLDN